MGIQLNGITGDITTPGDIGIGGTLTYEDVANVDSIGVITARSGINVSGGTGTFAGNINANGNIVGDNSTNISGINAITATSFSGDGANLTGVSGFSTALSNTEGTLQNLVFKTTETFTIGAGQSIRLESDNISGNTLFTRLGRINVSTGATFHVSAGTTFVMNVLSVF
tara:strand:+ start:1567 stop:2073 length:507 start_codon:yes stop_codon:yes gene_type:complete